MVVLGGLVFLMSEVPHVLVRIHIIIVMIRWTDLAPWDFDFSFPGSLTSTVLLELLLKYYDSYSISTTDQIAPIQLTMTPSQGSS